jgi:SNF2 family DNA or RNA helicase
MQTKLGKDFFYIKTPYKDRMFVAQALNGTWSKKEEMYRFPKNIHSMRELIKTYPELVHNSSFIQAGTRLRETQEKFLELKTKEDVQGDIRLRPYQRVDVEYLKQLPNAGIFNEPRTGKTPTSIILMKEMNFQSILVVCPSSLAFNWKKEFETWYPEIEIIVINGTPKQRDLLYKQQRDNKFVQIISKDTLKTDINKYEFEYEAVFVDEGHFLRNYKTKQSEAVYKVKAKHKYVLTGTPAVKGAQDFFGIIHFLYPEKFNSYWQFLERYFVIEETKFGKEIKDVKNGRKEEFRDLVSFISVQRRREDIMKWLPEKQYITQYVEMEGKQLKLYNDMVKDMLAEDENIIIDVANTLTQLIRLRQLNIDPRLLGIDCVGAKTKALLEFAENNNEPFIVMTTFSSYFKLIKPELEKLGKKVGVIDGSVNQKQKFITAEAFQKGNYDILLCNIIAAGTGFTLDRSDTILFLDKDFNPANNEQAQDRIVPVSEERNHNINIISLITANSIDERIDEIIKNKENLTAIVNKGGIKSLV